MAYQSNFEPAFQVPVNFTVSDNTYEPTKHKYTKKKLRSKYNLKKRTRRQRGGVKNPKKAENPDSRLIGVGAQILKDLGINKIRLLGASIKYPLTGFDLEITEFIN